ncbi:MAG TPA: DUF1810 domain-containing protein [Alloacidobacterium sp.]|nr:DUF1810 domain-containing protein [Alloacidobacterium sp.]
MSDAFDLQRFVDAQQSVYAQACAELREGEKRSHWMWFIFPQLRGLGQSSMAVRFGISSIQEASAYLAHPVLGPRLRECTGLVNAIEGRSIEQIFGHTDGMKFRSSMTLFAEADEDNRIFRDALGKYFHGVRDEATLQRL